MAWAPPQNVGDTQADISIAKAKLAKFSYGKDLGDTDIYTPEFGVALKTFQANVHALIAEGKRSGPDVNTAGVFDWATKVQLGLINPTPKPSAQPVMFTVEGHLSNMFAGPVADTATRLEREGVCHHQPIGYNNGAIPFDNGSGERELARLVGSTVLDTGTPFPAGTKWSLGTFSQGAIVGFDFYVDYLLPGKPLAWRTPDLVGVLAYGNPCRAVDSIAPWARSWTSTTGTHGLDPYRRFGANGFPAKPDNWMDVYREGDIFAENGDDKASEMKAAVYQAIARGDLFSNPYSLAVQIASVFVVPVEAVMGIVMACISGIGFLADGNGAPHYSPYDITGGVDWMRRQLAQ